jgi:cytochrome c-type biogenesis protein CcmH
MLSLGATDSGTRFNGLGHKLMCTCGCGQVLLECNHVGCEASDRMRKELTAAIQRGGSDSDVLNWFVQKYGPVVLAAPTKRGFDRVAWIMPYLILVLGLTLTALLVRAWKSRVKPATIAAPAQPEEMDALRRRIDEETRL